MPSVKGFVWILILHVEMISEYYKAVGEWKKWSKMALCKMKTNAIKVKFCYHYLLIVPFFQAMLKWKYNEQQCGLELAKKN